MGQRLSRDDVGNQCRVLLTEFILEILRHENVENVPAVDELKEPDIPPGLPLEHVKEICKALRSIVDGLDQDQRLQRIISELLQDASQQTFNYVVKDLFQEDTICWRRVATIFYIASKMVLKVLDRKPLINAIINWVTNFIKDNFAPWIIERGGWDAIVVEYLGTQGWQAVGVLVGGFAVASAFITHKIWG